jgi:molecular chaperone HtpG
MHDSDNETYLKFHKEFGSILKEGMSDSENKKRISDLLLFESIKTEKGKFTTLLDYCKAMPEDQKEIFYLIGETRAQLENAPCVEQIRAKGFDVLLLTDPVDEYMVEMLHEYDGKPLKAADRGALDEKPSDDQIKEYKPLTEFLAKAIPTVKEVRLSARLKESAAVLVADDYGPSAHLERLLKRMGRGAELGDSRRILELNPDHPLVQKLLALKQSATADDQVEDLGLLLKDQAAIAEGSKLDDPASFAKRMNRWIQKGL